VAEHAVVTVGELDAGLVMTPERYDPRRRRAGGGPSLRDVAVAVSEPVSSRTAHADRSYLVLDTSDAREGVVLTRKPPVPGAEIGSGKKRVQAGDVIVSRLRPYLRQVALVDAGLAADGVEIVCSTEFFVLRGLDEASIAFLVPVLLSAAAQEVLGAAQEGGHHPRFNLATLEAVGLPADALARRDELSREVERAVGQARAAELTLRALVGELDRGEAAG